jgi:hypothetical protein
MEKIMIITDATTEKVFAVATEEDGSLRIFGVDDDRFSLLIHAISWFVKISTTIIFSHLIK